MQGTREQNPPGFCARVTLPSGTFVTIRVNAPLYTHRARRAWQSPEIDLTLPPGASVDLTEGEPAAGASGASQGWLARGRKIATNLLRSLIRAALATLISHLPWPWISPQLAMIVSVLSEILWRIVQALGSGF